MANSAAERDVLIQRLSTKAAAKLAAPDLAAATKSAEALLVELEETFPHDSWQWRMLVIAVAQLRGQSGDHLWAARAWVEVARVASHRSEALPNARAAFLRAGAFDEWSELTDSKAPRMAPLLDQAKKPAERALVLDAIPLLEAFFTGQQEREGVFRAQGVDWKTLQALVKAKHAPKARPFLTSFPDSWTAPPVFHGVLALAAVPRGFFVTGVEATVTPKARALLKQASSSTRQFSRVIATWATPHAEVLPPKPAPSIGESGPRKGGFEAVVKELLNTHLEESIGNDVWWFSGAPFATIEELGRELGASFLEDCANNCPPVSQLLEATRSHAKRTTFGGHVVWPPRRDARVTVDAVTTPAAIPERWLETADEVVRRGRSTFLWWD